MCVYRFVSQCITEWCDAAHGTSLLMNLSQGTSNFSLMYRVCEYVLNLRVPVQTKVWKVTLDVPWRNIVEEKEKRHRERMRGGERERESERQRGTDRQTDWHRQTKGDIYRPILTSNYCTLQSKCTSACLYLAYRIFARQPIKNNFYLYGYRHR